MRGSSSHRIPATMTTGIIDATARSVVAMPACARTGGKRLSDIAAATATSGPKIARASHHVATIASTKNGSTPSAPARACASSAPRVQLGDRLGLVVVLALPADASRYGPRAMKTRDSGGCIRLTVSRPNWSHSIPDIEVHRLVVGRAEDAIGGHDPGRRPPRSAAGAGPAPPRTRAFCQLPMSVAVAENPVGKAG